jgi:hypothetical protein
MEKINMAYSVENINVNKTYEVNIISATISGNYTVDLSQGNFFRFNLSGDTTLNFENAELTTYNFMVSTGPYSFGLTGSWLVNKDVDNIGDFVISTVYDGVDLWASFEETFKPTDLDNLLLWLDANDSSTITIDGSDGVSEWRDKSGNNKHLGQTDSTKRLLYDSVNKRLDTQFEVETWLQRASDNDMIWDGQCTVFTVTENPDNQADAGDTRLYNTVTIGNSTNISTVLSRMECELRNPTDAPDYLEQFTARTSGVSFTVARYSPVIFDQKKLHRGVWDDDDIFIYLNGDLKESTLGTSTARSSTHNFTTIGKLNPNSTTGSDGQVYIHEIVLYKRVLSAQECAQVEAYLTKKWSL